MYLQLQRHPNIPEEAPIVRRFDQFSHFPPGLLLKFQVVSLYIQLLEGCLRLHVLEPWDLVSHVAYRQTEKRAPRLMRLHG